MSREQDLLRLKINEISIEHHATCNRKCPWCSNFTYPRDKSMGIMPEKMFKDLIQEIRDNMGYFADKLTLASCRYNEPFYRADLAIERMNYIKDEIPNAYVQVNTNGDYLNTDVFDRLHIDKMNILDYDMGGLPERMKRLQGWGAKLKKIDPKNSRIYASTKMIPSIVYRADFLQTSKLQDRGGTVESTDFEWAGKTWTAVNKEERHGPCLMVMTTVSIDYTGDVFLCYNVRHDVPDQAHMSVGNLNDNTLLEILEGEKTKELRKLASKWNNFEGPCKTCSNYRCAPDSFKEFYDETV